MENYDYIIAGGGSAGCVLANRLSADPSVSVLLIEAGGPDRHPLFHWPAGFAKMTKGIASWGWSTVPQKHLQGRVLRFTQAKVIGGGSSINAQLYTSGAAADYETWVRDAGPLGVSNPVSPLPICEAFFQAGQELGIPFNADFNGAAQDGLGYYQLTQLNARRSSGATAFLNPVKQRPNLTIKLHTRVLKVLLEGPRASRRAAGVTLVTGKSRSPATLRATREVIVSSGAIGSPQLLMLSGIGPGAHLRSLGLDVAHDPPGVGANLQDHLEPFVIAECTGDHSYDKYKRPQHAAWAGLQYLLFKRGPVASSLFETGGFWYADRSHPAHSPDIQLHLGLGSGIEAGMARMQNSGVTLNSAYLRPQSRGSVRLASADPGAAPLIDPNYWADSHDRAMAIGGLRLARDIMQQPALRRYVKTEILPGARRQSDQDLYDYACAHAKTDHHPVGTCRIGPESDAHSVVAPDLKLIGIEGLRVVDASVMPFVPSCNTNAPTIMVAEKAADHILGRL